jgi:hypothetical protein
MSELNRPERLQIMLNPEEIRALDDWRFACRMPSRAAAIRELLRRGLAVEGVALETDGKHSSRFGVLEETAAKPDDNGSKARGRRTKVPQRN